MKLRIGAKYRDKHIGELMYLGKIGSDYNYSYLHKGIKGKKGSNIFLCKSFTFVWLTKKDIELLSED